MTKTRIVWLYLILMFTLLIVSLVADHFLNEKYKLDNLAIGVCAGKGGTPLVSAFNTNLFKACIFEQTGVNND